MQAQLTSSQHQCIEVKKILETKFEQEKHSQDIFQETLNNAESQIRKWEEKYFRVYDQLNEAEARIKEMKEMEQKFHQMQSQTQALLSNLGQVFGTSTGQSKVDSQPHKFDESPRPRVQSDIFAKNDTIQQPKSTFFE